MSASKAEIDARRAKIQEARSILVAYEGLHTADYVQKLEALFRSRFKRDTNQHDTPLILQELKVCVRALLRHVFCCNLCVVVCAMHEVQEIPILFSTAAGSIMSCTQFSFSSHRWPEIKVFYTSVTTVACYSLCACCSSATRLDTRSIKTQNSSITATIGRQVYHAP